MTAAVCQSAFRGAIGRRPARWALAALAVFAVWQFGCDDLSLERQVARPAARKSRDKPRPRLVPSRLTLRVEREAVEVCERPLGLLLSADGATLFVACAGSGQVMAVDTENNEERWTSRPLFDRICKMAADEKRQRLFAVGLNGRTVHVLDADGEVIKQISVGGNIADMAAAAGADRLVVAIAQPPQATLIDLNTMTIDGLVAFPSPPGSLTIRRDGQLAVASSGVWQVRGQDFTPMQEPVYLFDPRQGGRMTRLGLGGAQARQTAFTPDSGNLLVAERTSDSVAIFDVNHRRLLRTAQVGAAPEKIVVSPDGRWAFTLDSKGASVTRIDLQTREASGYAALPSDPQDLTISADGRELYAAMSGAEGKRGAVAVIDVSSMSLVDAIPVGRDPCSLTTSADGAKLYVGNFLSDSVSVLE